MFKIQLTSTQIDKLIQESKGHPADLQRLAAEVFIQKTELAVVGKPQTFHTGERQRK